jgi:hypothetical protein
MEGPILIMGLVVAGLLAFTAWVVINEFDNQSRCEDLGGVYHRGLCQDPDNLMKGYYNE